MSEWEERLNSILSDPAQMERITAMAQSLMGPSEPPKAAPPPSKEPQGGLFDGFDPRMLTRLTGALSAGSSDHKQALLDAMKPYLSPKRREKLERAMKLAKMIHVAEIAFGSFGGEGNAKI